MYMFAIFMVVTFHVTHKMENMNLYSNVLPTTPPFYVNENYYDTDKEIPIFCKHLGLR